MTAPADTYPTYRSRPERLALMFVLMALLGIPLIILAYQFFLAPHLSPLPVIELVGRLPTTDHGGWTPENVTLQKGEKVRLRLTSADVVHGFAIPKLGIEGVWVEPGKVQEFDLVADQPGRYEFLCTVWCDAGHWRMRGTITVIDPEHPEANLNHVSPPETNWLETGIDLDAEHPGAHVPEGVPDAVRGAGLWQRLSVNPILTDLAYVDFRTTSPSDIYASMAGSDWPFGELIPSLSDEERWDLIAYLWQQRASPQALERGEFLYQRDCTGCHGLAGAGDGPGADRSVHLDQGHEAMSQPATDFTNTELQMGAADMLYYGKLVRGGMGTSMPYWGTVYGEDDLWAVIAYLRTFVFDVTP